MSEQSSPESTEGIPKRKKPVKRQHIIGRVVLASVVVLGMVTALSVVFIYRHLNGNLKVENVTSALGDERPEEIYEGNGEPLDILILGDDTRSGKNKIDGESGGGSDTTILVHLSADRSRAYAVSIPRDSIVDRPECGKDDEVPAESNAMWNAAYAIGGPACTIRQLEATTGVRVEHYVVVDFNGFKDMVDAVGGVPMCIPEDIDDPGHDIFIPAGDEVLLKGDQALDYVRVRYFGAEKSDISRIKRQQAFIAALVNKVKSAGTLSRLDRVVKFLDAATKSLTLDEGLGSLTKIGKIGMQLQGIGLDKVQFVTIPNAYYTRDSDYFGRVYWTPEAKDVWKKIQLDEPLSRQLTGGSITAAKPPGSSKSPSSPGTTDSPSNSASPTPEEARKAAEEAKKVGLCV